jgi:3-oxoacyl-[acyl-carrier protein] reductase
LAILRKERADEAKKLRATEIAYVIKAALEMDNRGFIPELSVWATNPF